ncbi:SDR family oxidoreductase [Luminiphilus sp.]|nr:SDR family oxidoreductase [Luminiphilus sp.]
MNTIRTLQNLAGRQVLVTGATGSLGVVIAETLAELGAGLILVDIPGANFSGVKARILDAYDVDIDCYECDLESESERVALGRRVTEKYESLSCLVNNAAFVGSSDLAGWGVQFEHQSLDTWRRAFEVNLTSIFHLCQVFAPLLRAPGNGNILNIASIYGEYGPDWSLYDDSAMGNPAAYSASKGGLIQLTRWLSTTLAPNVRVNAISPGGIFRNQHEKFVERYVQRTPMARMAHEGDFRGSVAYLASDMSGYVTGQVLRVDGGWGVW